MCVCVRGYSNARTCGPSSGAASVVRSDRQCMNPTATADSPRVGSMRRKLSSVHSPLACGGGACSTVGRPGGYAYASYDGLVSDALAAVKFHTKNTIVLASASRPSSGPTSSCPLLSSSPWPTCQPAESRNPNVGVDKRLEETCCKGELTTPKTHSWGLKGA